EIQVTESSQDKGLINMLCLNAESNVHTDPKQTRKDLECAWKLSLLIGQGKTLLHLLVQIASERITVRSYNRCLIRLAPAKAGMQGILDSVKNLNHIPQMGAIFENEAYLGVVEIRNVDLYGGPEQFARWTNDEATMRQPNPSTLRRDWMPNDPWLRAYMVRNLKFWIYAGKREDPAKKTPDEIVL